MKKIFALFLVISMGLSVNAFENIVADDVSTVKEEVPAEDVKPLEAEISFDWLDISTAQRMEQIGKYREILFTQSGNDIYFTKDEFKKEFANYFKDKDFKHHYMLTNNGVTEDEDAQYCAFYYKKNTLVMYAIQYKKNPHNAFYYTAFGKLYYVDVTSENYPQFPYYSMQYNRNGQLRSAIYFISKDIQYMYAPDGKFQGIWYKDKMYDENGKQTLTRTNW